jgi:hypothetical protein
VSQSLVRTGNSKGCPSSVVKFAEVESKYEYPVLLDYRVSLKTFFSSKQATLYPLICYFKLGMQSD